eukprot:CAMPEP_0195527424 /NCGR_PEP_ID=MMETSP0794_2-20130614/29097_1 /TAXON_ID=515487 /ORGANISM="Stephanopyxis turris, Strain CCMP 815" /LENGTH=77 /DNA_ID=CAMNT_0040658323 /DNA_START=357 /DNA_END=588 /DNA_ORIENTATION=+
MVHEYDYYKENTGGTCENKNSSNPGRQSSNPIAVVVFSSSSVHDESCSTATGVTVDLVDADGYFPRASSFLRHLEDI